MKLHIVSDLHLGFSDMAPPSTDADVVVLAGDIARPQEAVAWAQGFSKPVLCVLGNHEFYGGSIDGTAQAFQRLCDGTHLQLLDRRSVVIGGVRFLGATLWTDFELFGDPGQRAAAMTDALRMMRDFSRIRRHQAGDALFTPQDSIELFKRDAQWLADTLATPHGGPTVVITHHAPSPRSIHPRFADSLLNTCFVSDAEHLLDGRRVQLWIHGHTHDSFDYQVKGTRVVCNPRGYARHGVNENALFQPDLVVDVPAPP